MANTYINIYNSIKNYKFDDDTIAMFPGTIISVALVVYAKLII